MKKIYHAESAINACWRKLTGLLSMAWLGAVIGLCLAAVFSAVGGAAKAQTGTEAADSNLLISLNQFFGLEETEDGLQPDFLIAVDHTGEWQSNPLAFHVPASQQENTGVLSLQVDRASAGEDLVLALTYGDDQAKGSLFIGLSYWPEGLDLNENESAIFLGDLFGNIMQGQGEITTAYFEIPLQRFAPPYLNIDIYRGKGEITISGAALYTRSEFNYWLEQALVQGGAGLEMPDGAAEQDEGKESAHSVAADSGSRATIAARRQEAGAPGMMELAAEQIAAAAQVAANLMITRSVLSGGGTRQRSAKFILEDTFAQPSAVGFSYGGGIMLHAGYQQADDQSLAITNVSVIPSGFNPFLGEVATLFYVLSTRPRSISIEVYDTVTPATFTLTNNMPQGPGLGSFVWDGKDTNGNLLAPADWTFRILARDYQGRVIINEDAQVTIVPAATMPVILAVDDNPDPFCPAADVTNAISYTTAESKNRGLDVTVAIEDALGNPVTNFSASDQAPGSYSFNWDGANAGSGLYVYRVNAKRSQGGQPANERTGSIILFCGQDSASSPDGAVQVLYQPGAVSLSILPADPGQLSSAAYALLNQPGLLFQSGVYDIQATPSTGFDPPLILTFSYDSAISGAIGGTLELRRYDEATASWVAVANQFIDYANNQIIAEVTSLSLFALFAVEKPSVPTVLRVSVRLKPEVLKVNPGILTAFVSLPAGYAASGISAATCEGAAAESMELSSDGTEMVFKFRRRAIEEALAEQGEALDTHFVVEGTWQGPEGAIPFVGADDISRIVN